MKCSAIILFAAAALVGCLARTINAELPQDLLVPFNDLLPPLLEPASVDGAAAKGSPAPATTGPKLAAAQPVATTAPRTAENAKTKPSTVSTTKQAAPALAAKARLEAKPTKKSYYQQQQEQQKHKQHQQPQQQIVDSSIRYTTPGTPRRPPKGALPTLTPFPRHLKKN